MHSLQTIKLTFFAFVLKKSITVPGISMKLKESQLKKLKLKSYSSI